MDSIEREPIERTGSIIDVLVTLSEGNPGAASVWGKLVKYDILKVPKIVTRCEEHNLRGEQIWVGYKDHCGEDLDTFVEAMLDDEAFLRMADTIDEACGDRYLVER